MGKLSLLLAYITTNALFACGGTESGVDVGTIVFNGSSVKHSPSLFFDPTTGLQDGEQLDRGMDSPKLLVRQRTQCPLPVKCPGNTCCPAGTTCCCPTGSTCRTEFGGTCCPNEAQTCGGTVCAEPGSICCGNTVCPAGTECNTLGGNTSCCRPGEVKCRGGCCPAGSKCTNVPGTCSRETTDCEPGVNRLPGCEYECHNGKLIPVADFDNVPGVTDQLVISMCSGILTTGGKRGGDGLNFDILNYAGKFGKRERRRKARCKGFCREQANVFNDPAKLECDEYPPAMAVQGGEGAHRLCIPKEQNSGAQGRRLSRFVRQCQPKRGDQFVLRMRGGCNLRSPNVKRDVLAWPLSKRQSDSVITFNASSAQLHTISSNDSYVYVPLEDLRTGRYTLVTNYSTAVRRVEVVDSDGEVYFEADRPANGPISFNIEDVDDDDPLPAALIVETERNVSVTYSAVATLSPSPVSINSTNSAGLPYFGLKADATWMGVMMVIAGLMVFAL